MTTPLNSKSPSDSPNAGRHQLAADRKADQEADQETSRVLITVATYNEIENIPKLVEAIWDAVPDVDILVIDDNSPDGTGRWVSEQMESRNNLHLIERAGKLGLGTATIAGIQYGIDHNYDIVLNMDADFSHSPEYLPTILDQMLAPDSEIDVLIGSRYVPGGKIVDWPFSRHVMSFGVNVYSRWALGLKPKDCSGAYRAMRVSLLKQINFDEILAKGYAFQEEFLWRMKRCGARFAETPITFIDRRAGESKIDAKEAASAVVTIFRLGIKNWIGI